MKLILVRHGRSIANHKFKHQGKEDKWKDTKLSNVGKFQAKELSNRLKEEKIDLIYSSPLKRAKQTAEIINKVYNKKILFDPRLKEKSDFENKEDFIKRVESLLNELKEENKTILFVTHGGVILTLLAISTGDRKAGGELINKLNYSVGNCSISIIEKEK